MQKAINFALVGAVNTLVDFGIFSVAWSWFGLSPLLANLLAWFVAVSGSYLMNCMTTFAEESSRKISLNAYMTFIVSGAAGLMIGTATLLIAATFIPVLAAKLIAVTASFVLNFSLARFVVFPPPEAKG